MDDRRVPNTDAEMEANTVGGLTRLDGPIVLWESDPNWPVLFKLEDVRIRRLLGTSVCRLEHVGSTSVPGLLAKPIIDMVLVVPSSEDEPAYLPALESAGYVLRIREPDWFEHRVLKGPDTDINLHVFSDGCSEIDRMIRFRDRLRTDAAALEQYATAKRELAARTWRYVQNYADAKNDVIDELQASDQF